MELTLHNQASEISLAHQALDRFVAEHALPAASLARLHVALEEHLTNIISHGYNGASNGVIRVRFAVDGSGLRVEIEDDARPFNPLEAAEVDTSLSLDKKAIGGLGVLLIRKSVDHLAYQRVGERNLLVMTTRLAPG